MNKLPITQIVNKNDNATVYFKDIKQFVTFFRALQDQVDNLDPVSGTVLADIIKEFTANAGVTFQSHVLLPDGSNSIPSLGFANSTQLGIRLVNATTLGITSGGALVVSFDATGVITAAITEAVGGSGIQIISSVGNITLLPDTGWILSTGASAKGGFDTASVDLPTLAANVKAMQDLDMARGFTKS